MHLIRGLKAARKESGQALIFFALWLPIILIFVGFAVDFGFGFLTKLRLAKACDAAALKVMYNLGQGQTSAIAIGQSVFASNINANSSLPYSIAPTANFNIVTTGSQPVVTVTAAATIRTFFIRIAGPSFETLSVSDTSQATRPPVLLSLVLDRSGSMTKNGGSTALPPAVLEFLVPFIPGTDQLGIVSFSTDANADVPITTQFVTPITSFANGMTFQGGTDAYDGLNDAQTMVTGVANPPTNTEKVVVFFTDGWANMVTGPLNGTKVKFGGCAPAEFPLGWCNGLFYWNNTTSTAFAPNPDGSVTINSVTEQVTLNGANTFTPTDTGPPDNLPNPAKLTSTNVAEEADYETVQLANSLRANGYTVYSIGMGSEINQTYLQQIANDPASPTYSSSSPSGIAVFAPTADDLQAAFTEIADKILQRITH